MMMKKLSRLFTCLLSTLLCISAMLPSTLATNLSTGLTNKINISSNNIIEMPSKPVEFPAISTRAGAPQVTKLEYFDSGIIEGTDHFGVIIKVTGYGNDSQKAYWDDTQLSSNDKSLYGYWVGADKRVVAFAYLYDCGPVTEVGVHTFKTTYTSTNWPYTQKSISLNFKFE